MNQLATSLTYALLGLPALLALQERVQPVESHPTPTVISSESVTQPGLIVIDITNRAPSPIDAFKLEARYLVLPGSQVHRLVRTEDYYAAIGLNTRPVGVGPIEPGESRRYLFRAEETAIQIVGMAVSSVIFRDGQLLGSPEDARFFTDRRRAVADVLDGLLKLIGDARSLGPSTLRERIKAGVESRRHALPGRYVGSSADHLYEVLEASLNVGDGALAASIANVEEYFRSVKANALRPVGIR